MKNLKSQRFTIVFEGEVFKTEADVKRAIDLVVERLREEKDYGPLFRWTASWATEEKN